MRDIHLQNLFALKLSDNNNGSSGYGVHKKRNVFHRLMIKNCISICKHGAVPYFLVICHVACHYSLSVCRQGLLNSPVFFSPMLSDSYKFNRVQSFRVSSRLSQYSILYQENAISRLQKVSYSASRLYWTWLSLSFPFLPYIYNLFSFVLILLLDLAIASIVEENRSPFLHVSLMSKLSENSLQETELARALERDRL